MISRIYQLCTDKPQN